MRNNALIKRIFSGLVYWATDLLLDFFESSFDLPACAVEFDYLLGSKIQVGGKEFYPLLSSIDPDDTHGTLEYFSTKPKMSLKYPGQPYSCSTTCISLTISRLNLASASFIADATAAGSSGSPVCVS